MWIFPIIVPSTQCFWGIFNSIWSSGLHWMNSLRCSGVGAICDNAVCLSIVSWHRWQREWKRDGTSTRNCHRSTRLAAECPPMSCGHFWWQKWRILSHWVEMSFVLRIYLFLRSVLPLKSISFLSPNLISRFVGFVRIQWRFEFWSSSILLNRSCCIVKLSYCICVFFSFGWVALNWERGHVRSDLHFPWQLMFLRNLVAKSPSIGSCQQ